MAIELPEALRIAKQMNTEFKGKKIKHAFLTQCESLLREGFANLAPDDFGKSLVGKTIENVTSKGRWIFVKIVPDLYLLLSLYASGKILYRQNKKSVPEKFNVKIEFEDNSLLTVRIIAWGFAKVVKENELELHEYPGKLGLFPTDDKEFNYKNFNNLLSCFNGPVKEFTARMVPTPTHMQKALTLQS